VLALAGPRSGPPWERRPGSRLLRPQRQKPEHTDTYRNLTKVAPYSARTHKIGC